MKCIVAAVVTALTLFGACIAPSAADEGAATTQAGTAHNWIWVKSAQATDSFQTGGVTAAVHHQGTLHVTGVCALRGSALCYEFASCQGGEPERQSFYVDTDGTVTDLVHWCPSDAAAAVRPVLTPGRVLEAFRRLPLPESPLLIEPSGGETIVNFKTIFYTTRGPLTRTVRLLGHRVSFSIEPSRFTWVWGDGGRAVTTSPGRPYRSGVPVARDITHRYLTKDRFAPRLDTTYTATYSVDGGPARPVGGTVTIAGTPQELRTVTYTPLLVDD